MKTYQFESIIEESGVITLPKHMKELKNHRVKLTMTDLEPIQDDDLLKRFKEITRKYAAIDDEPDLDIDEIYKQRGPIDDRGLVFD